MRTLWHLGVGLILVTTAGCDALLGLDDIGDGDGGGGAATAAAGGGSVVSSGSGGAGGGTAAGGGTPACFGSSPDVDGSPLFTLHATGDAQVFVRGLAVDSANNTVFGALFAGSMSICGAPYTAVGAADSVVVKVDPSGSCLWHYVVSGTGNDQLQDVGVDAADNVILGGSFTGQLEIGSALSATVARGFIAKLDGGGNPLWAQSITGSGTSQVWSVAVDDSDRIWITGDFSTQATLPGNSILSTQSTHSAMFVTRLNAAGFNDAMAQVHDHSSGRVTGTQVVTLPGGGAAVTGIAAGGISIDGVTNNGTGVGAFVQFVDDEAVATRTIMLEGNDVVTAADLAAVAQDRVVLVGAYRDTMNFCGTFTTPDPGIHDGFIARIDRDGSCLLRRISGAYSQAVGAVALEEDGRLWVGGAYEQNTHSDPDDVPLYTGSARGPFLMNLSAELVPGATFTFTDSNWAEVDRLAMVPGCGELRATLEHYGNLTLDGTNTLVGNSNGSGLLASFD